MNFLIQLRRNRGWNGGDRPRMLKTRGQNYLFAPPPPIICQVYQLVASQTSISLYSFIILIRCSFVYCIIDMTTCRILRIKCTKFDFRWGSATGSSVPASRWGAYPLAVLERRTSKYSIDI